jgi:hypothetical protein
MDIGWPTPTGLGSAVTRAYVGIVHPGVCALVWGIRIIDAPIEVINNIANKMANFLFLVFDIFSISLL